MKILAFGKRSRSDLSGRESFNNHVDWCFYLAIAICVSILLKTALLQLTDLLGKRAKETKQKHLREELLRIP